MRRATRSLGQGAPIQSVPQAYFPSVSRWIYKISFPTMPATSDGDVNAEVLQSGTDFFCHLSANRCPHRFRRRVEERPVLNVPFVFELAWWKRVREKSEEDKRWS